ncbi:hypothetical protein BpHYR1_037701 [Brachionus plicatilis]|uniref:Uncharacterized protein n=1 Tax=Brachionus plicatilis TaxID=10195 RepID=A0A3M7P7D3_BRAPC|nr:hypothetical protein BpHYR1_037701 [Brachionus plicatilis]
MLTDEITSQTKTSYLNKLIRIGCTKKLKSRTRSNIAHVANVRKIAFNSREQKNQLKITFFKKS